MMSNSNQQLRFITLIDILYEKKIILTLSLADNLNLLGSSKIHAEAFKRTLSRLFEMTKDYLGYIKLRIYTYGTKIAI